MITYSIKNWDLIYENNRTRELKRLDWVPIPNRLDTDGYSYLMSLDDGPQLFAVWIVLVQLASRSPTRGVLLRPNSEPHNSLSISRITRIPFELVTRAVSILAGGEVDWLYATPPEFPINNYDPIPQPDATIPQDVALDAHLEPHYPAFTPPPVAAPRCPEGKGREVNGTEWNTEEPAAQPSPEPLSLEAPPEETKPSGRFSRKRTSVLAVGILEHLNAKADRKFRDTPENLNLIAARLEEIALDTEGVRTMIDRQCARWKGDAKMEEYLRPSTLFNKQKFSGYYDDRNQPVRTTDTHAAIDHSKGF